MFKKNIKYITLDTTTLSKLSINSIVNTLYDDTISLSDVSTKFAVQLQIKVNDTIRSISKIQVVNNETREELKSVLTESFHLLYSHYSDMDISKLLIRYTELDHNNPKAKLTLSSVIKNTQIVPPTEINFPPFVDLNKWGIVVKLTPNLYIITGFIENIIYSVDCKFCRENYVTNEIRNVKVINKNTGVILTCFQDNIPDLNIDSFTRTLENKSVIEYVSGKQTVFFPKVKPTPIIPSLVKDSMIRKNYVALDLETCLMNDGSLVIESAALCSGSKTWAWHIGSYTDLFGDLTAVNKLLMDLLNQLLKLNIDYNKKNKTLKKWTSTTVYVHNFSGFDSIFLIRFLALNSDTFRINRREGSVISITIKKKHILAGVEYNTQIIFKDSYLILPASLAKLAETFGTTPKGNFNTMLIKEGYERGQYKNSLLKYNKQDCLILVNIIEKFSTEIFNLFKIDIHNYPTLASLTFAIWRSNFLNVDKTKINITDLNLYEKLHSGYTGGAVDVFKPTNPNGTKVFWYDVNSMYPSVMEKQEFPVGTPIHFEGIKELDTFFGFAYAEINAPLDLKYQLLQKRINNKTVSGVGTWEGWYFTEELKQAKILGYKIKIKSGIQYEKDFIFKGFINKIYNLRLMHPKGTPMNLICKLLMNSLYGKFGMSPRMSVGIVESSLMASKKSIFPSDFININDDLNINFYDVVKNSNLDYNSEEEYEKIIKSAIFINLPIAMAVTSYARIELMKYRTKSNGEVLYIDTDSVVTTQELDKNLIGNELGKIKLEYQASKAVFIAPKVYGIKLLDGKEIIKIKGSKNNDLISVSSLEKLLVLDSSIELNQEKWFRNITDSTINIRSTIYTLKVTQNKRQLIYLDDVFNDTKPHVINNGVIISSNLVINYSTIKLIEAPKLLLISPPTCDIINFVLINDVIELPAPKPVLMIE